MSNVREAVARTELAKAASPGQAMAEAVAEGKVKASAVLRAVGIDSSNPMHQAMLLVAQKYDLDALLGHVMILPKGGKPYITRDGFLHIAHRSGDFDGLEISDETETPTHYYARATVWRKNMGHPISVTAKYPKAGQNREFAEEMAVVRAVRRALKHAFDVSDDFAHIGGADIVFQDEPEPLEAVSAPVDEQPAE